MIVNSKVFQLAIVEDEEHNRNRLMEYLELFELNYKIVGVAESIQEAEKLLLTKEIDLLFLDMKLPDGEGVDLLRRIGKMNFKTIFFTAHKDYALSAFEFESVDYLLKPLELKAFSRAISRFLRETASNDHSENHRKDEVISIPHKEGSLYFKSHEIQYFLAYGEYCYLITNDKKLLVPTTLKEIEKILPVEQFSRIHRSYLVNVSKIKFYQKKGRQYVIIENGEELPISRRKQNEIKNLLND